MPLPLAYRRRSKSPNPSLSSALRVTDATTPPPLRRATMEAAVFAPHQVAILALPAVEAEAAAAAALGGWLRTA
uniref:Uncharacterized protein n=1 Tax=Oryza barthii TaxID=65489 RepID=A0A0D3GZ55_9ORYZ